MRVRPQPRLRLQRLSRDHDVSGFESGSEELDDRLHQHALAAQEMDTPAPSPCSEAAEWSATSALPWDPFSEGTLRLGWCGACPPTRVGMVLLARLAIDRRRQGQGLP